jgi:hypothetical protein
MQYTPRGVITSDSGFTSLGLGLYATFTYVDTYALGIGIYISFYRSHTPTVKFLSGE